MLRLNCDAKEFEKYGFKRCKGIPKDSECYYLCVARGCKMLFVSNVCFDVFNALFDAIRDSLDWAYDAENKDYASYIDGIIALGNNLLNQLDEEEARRNQFDR